MDKCIDSIKLHLSEELKQDIQDLAMLDERSVSEWIRLELEDVVYGKSRRVCCEREGAKGRQEGRK